MAQLWYKTRGESSPDRKQKVYFSAHPKDYHLLDGIAAEILELQNCAVWYDTEPEAEFDEKEFSSRLEEMQLFVMPVTRRLLTQPCRALEFEFELAQRRHIPVLPLMQEEGLDELFNEKCGDLQYLYKYSRDTTGISYEEKFKKYLESVLVGEEDAKRIREAFAAYIFLSYRKKDREHAQKLMRLIHKVDFCRDVAIWYDEFLTPGENFTNLIKESLEKSSLFVLAVTPNLLERKNYVMQVEYPMAVKSEKPILPTEMVNTNDRKLRRDYKDIPECVDAYDNNELRNALGKHFLSIKQNNSPEQHYLMGLAYLNGVDVERDDEKAVSLITAAAEQEHIEALEKTVQMYREGLGVKRSFEVAVKWQRKLVDVRGMSYRQSGNEEDAKMFFSALRNLGDYIYELRRIEETRAVYMRMLKVSRECAGKFSSASWIYRNISVSYNRLGDIYRDTGNIEEAKKYYEKMLSVSLDIAKVNNSEEAQSDISIGYERLGDVYRASGDLGVARDYYQKSLDVSGAIAKNSNSAEVRRDISASYNKLGNICYKTGDLIGAEEYYKKMLDISVSIAKENDSIQAQSDISICYDGLGDICRDKGDLKRAKEYYRKSLAIRSNIAKERDSIEAQCGVSICYDRLGDVCWSKNDLKGARKYYMESFAIRLRVAKTSDSIQAHRELSVSYFRLGNICESSGDLKRAKEYYKKCLDIRRAIAEKDKSVRAYDDLAEAYFKFGTFDRKNPDLEVMRKAYDVYVLLSEMCPDVARYKESRDILGELFA